MTKRTHTDEKATRITATAEPVLRQRVTGALPCVLECSKSPIAGSLVNEHLNDCPAFYRDAVAKLIEEERRGAERRIFGLDCFVCKEGHDAEREVLPFFNGDIWVHEGLEEGAIICGATKRRKALKDEG